MATITPHTVEPLKPWQRIAGVLIMLGVNFLYIPINRSVSGGIAPHTPLDDLIPFWPIWSVPYLFSLLWWWSAAAWAGVSMGASQFKTLVISVLIVTLSSYVFYLIFPTYVSRPEPVGDHWTMDLIRFIYGNDQPYNALPSGHTYNTTLIAIFWWHWKPRWRVLWVTSVLIVILSTLFIKQHYALDPIFGVIWAAGSVWIATRLTGWRLIQA